MPAASSAAEVLCYGVDVKPLNNPGVPARGTFTHDVGTPTLTARIVARGLVPNQTHLKHIHGRADEPAATATPTSADDLDGDGFVELTPGAPVYGPILLLQDTSMPGFLSGFPTARPTARSTSAHPTSSTPRSRSTTDSASRT